LKQQVQSGDNPRDIKFLIAGEMVERFHSKQSADQAKELFINQFKHGQLPDDIATVSVKISEVESESGSINIPKVLYLSTLVNSVTEGHRAIEAGSVRLEGEKIENSQLKLDLKTKHIFSIGKRRFAKVEFN